GPIKRLIKLRPAIRNRDHVDRVPQVSYVSTMSKQG
ncbi:MAG: 50S ribosomal protein L3, partial [Methanomicrobium sp.]|nr:50S ribosomal protein L3 [Methanomicrobium sp.]